MRRALLIAVGVLLVGASGSAQKAAPPAAAAPARITTPKQELGHNIGDDYFLANYQQISAYWKKLEQESPRIKLQEMGKTAEGRTQLMAVVTSPENHRRLARYKAISARLAHAEGLTDDQARALAKEGKTVVWIDGGLHATEVLGAQQLGEKVYQFVSRTDDALRSRRPIYRLADPIVRFHHVVTRRDLARFEERRTLDAWRDAQPRFATHVLGPHFEEIAREFTFRFAADETVGGRAATVGPAVVNDSAGRTQQEIDVVVLGRDPSGAEIVLSLGEAKHTTAKRTLADLQRLERVRGLVADKRPSAASAKLLLFSASGFERNLINDAQQRHDVELIDLVRIYGGE